MKNLLLTLLFGSLMNLVCAQWEWGINFDTSEYLNRIVRDTRSNPNCSWQIGKPNKSVFDSAHSQPNAIVTLLNTSVPANDTSIFYLKHERVSMAYHDFRLNFKYKMHGDETDRGIIEVSPDDGKTWVNVMTKDTQYWMKWHQGKPKLHGSVLNWTSVELDMYFWASAYIPGGRYDPLFTADTILIRFTYITDANKSAFDGWIIDDIWIQDKVAGVISMKTNSGILLYPNPATEILQIKVPFNFDIEHIEISDLIGKKVPGWSRPDALNLDIRNLRNGIYQLHCFSKSGTFISRFLVQH